MKRRLVADVPLGVLLSGGVDSSAVAALMQSESGHPVWSFTVGFENAGFDEAGHAKAVAQHIGTEHQELYLSDASALELVQVSPIGTTNHLLILPHYQPGLWRRWRVST